MLHNTISRRLLIVVIAATLTGCGWVPPMQYGPPGPANYQRHMAERFDPYPEDDIGPPVVGGRPLGFTNPVAEPLRARRSPSWSLW